MKDGTSVKLTCNLMAGNKAIRFDIPSNIVCSWPIPMGTEGTVEKSNDNEVLVRLVWSYLIFVFGLSGE